MGIIKVFGRTLVFLLAAVIVLAGVNALNSAGVLSSVPGGPPEGGFQPNSAAQTSTDGTSSTTAMTQSAFDREGGDHASEGFSLMGLTTVAKNLGQMSIIIAVVTLLRRAIKLMDKRRMMSTRAQ